MTGNLMQLMTQLGMVALKLSAKMEQITASFVVETDDETRELTDQLVIAAIAYTTRLLVVSDAGSKFRTAAVSGQLEKKLIAGFRNGATSPGSSENVKFARAAETLAAAAKLFAYELVELAGHVQSGADPSQASSESHEPARLLANAAITFTVQMLIRHGGLAVTPVEAQRVEEGLCAVVNAAYAPPRKS